MKHEDTILKIQQLLKSIYVRQNL